MELYQLGVVMNLAQNQPKKLIDVLRRKRRITNDDVSGVIKIPRKRKQMKVSE